MTASENEVIRDVARDIITQIAPNELRIFAGLSEDYFTNPREVLKNLKSEDKVLGFGTDSATALLTPIVYAALSEVFQVLINVAKTAVEDGLGSKISDVIKSMFRRFDSSQPSPLSLDQIALVREKVSRVLRAAKLPDDRADLIVNAVVGQLVIAGQ
jgi:hypothetical protein